MNFLEVDIYLKPTTTHRNIYYVSNHLTEHTTATYQYIVITMHSQLLIIDTNLMEDGTCHGTKHKIITKIHRKSKVQKQQQFHQKQEL
jgi:hypothetical protein